MQKLVHQILKRETSIQALRGSLETPITICANYQTFNHLQTVLQADQKKKKKQPFAAL